MHQLLALINQQVILLMCCRRTVWPQEGHQQWLVTHHHPYCPNCLLYLQCIVGSPHSFVILQHVHSSRTLYAHQECKHWHSTADTRLQTQSPIWVYLHERKKLPQTVLPIHEEGSVCLMYRMSTDTIRAYASGALWCFVLMFAGIQSEL